MTATHEFLNQLCNGEGLDPAHLEKSTKNCACAVCNSTHPCLFALNSDPAETTNVAALYPAVVETLQAKLLADGSAYIDGTMDPSLGQELREGTRSRRASEELLGALLLAEEWTAHYWRG